MIQRKERVNRRPTTQFINSYAMDRVPELNGSTIVLKKNERRPCSITVRRVSREVMLMSEVWAVVPMTNDRYRKSR